MPTLPVVHRAPLLSCLLLAGLLCGCGEPATTICSSVHSRLDTLHIPASRGQPAIDLSSIGSGRALQISEDFGNPAGYSGGFVPWFLSQGDRSSGLIRLEVDSLFPLRSDPRHGVLYATLYTPVHASLVGELHADVPMDQRLPTNRSFLDTLILRDTTGILLRIVDSSRIDFRGASEMLTNAF